MVEQDTPIGTSYGTASRRSARGPLLWMFVAVVAIYWIAAGFCIAVDPFDIYPWGLHPHLKPANYPPDTVPYLVDVVAKDPAIDAILVGSSTSVDFTRAMMQAVPGVKNPFNLSYEGGLPLDREIVTDELLKYSQAQRIVLAFDYTYALDQNQLRDGFPLYLYDANPFDDLRMVGSTAGLMAISALLHHGEISNGGGQVTATKHALQFKSFQTQGAMSQLARIVSRYRGQIDAPSAKTCADFPAIGQQLAPYARELSRRHVALDIFIPPYALVAYYDWQNGLRRGQLGDSILNDQLLMRRCLVNAVEGLAGVRVFAFDNENWITGDLANYKDTAHVYDPAIQAFIMKAIADGTHRLTKANVDAYLDMLHKNILAARVYNSRIKAFPQ